MLALVLGEFDDNTNSEKDLESQIYFVSDLQDCIVHVRGLQSGVDQKENKHQHINVLETLALEEIGHRHQTITQIEF